MTKINRGDSMARLESDSWWAHAVLDVSADASEEAIDTALVKNLERECYSPGGDVILAFDQARGRVSPETHRYAALNRAIYDQLALQVDQFALAYFQLSQTERLDVWKQLWNRSAPFPMLRRRLVWLSDGLTIDLPQIVSNEPMMASLIALIRECYTATPWRAVRARQRAANSIQESLPEWLSALAELDRMHPEFVRLDEELVKWLERRTSYLPFFDGERNQWNAKILDRLKGDSAGTREMDSAGGSRFDDQKNLESMHTVRSASARPYTHVDPAKPRPNFFHAIEKYGTTAFILFFLASSILILLLSVAEVIRASYHYYQPQARFPGSSPGVHDSRQIVDDSIGWQKFLEDRRLDVPANALEPENGGRSDAVVAPNSWRRLQKKPKVR